MFIYVVMCRWMDVVCSVSLYVSITHSFMTFMMPHYGHRIEIELIVGWLEDELMRVLRFFVVGVM